MLGKVIVEGLKLIDVNLKPCSYYILTSTGGSKRAWGLTKHEVVIQIKLVTPINYTIVRIKVVVTHVIWYDVLVSKAILYPLGVTLDFWGEIIYYQPEW